MRYYVCKIMLMIISLVLAISNNAGAQNPVISFQGVLTYQNSPDSLVNETLNFTFSIYSDTTKPSLWD
ncbi:MAG: hypothetical protein ACE5I5_18040, partial [Candidatus Heimdallarchaeota archaeon]